MIILGLGSNVGDRVAYLRQAVAAIREIMSDVRCSPVYESPALMPAGAPPEWNVPFLNMAVCGKTALAPHALLAEVKAMETRMGRLPRGHWGPREIDMDILAMDAQVIDSEDLIIPHPALLSRDFACVPFAELAPDWVHPVAGRPIRELALAGDNLMRTEIVII